MTDSSQPTSPPPPPPPVAGPPPSSTQAAPSPTQKKGIPPLGWVALGCGCLVLLAGASAVFLTGWVFKRAGETISDFADNPVMAAAERAVEASPEVELVSSDREEGRLEIRDKKSGETYWIDASDITQGQIRFGKGDEERVLSFEGEDGQGTVTLEGPEGESRMRVGQGAGGEVPDWLPVPPGAETDEGVFSVDTPEGRSGTLTLVTDQSVDDVAAFYRERLEDDGWKVSRATYAGEMGEGATLNATSPDGQRTLILGIARKGDRTTVGVFHSGGE